MTEEQRLTLVGQIRADLGATKVGLEQELAALTVDAADVEGLRRRIDEIEERLSGELTPVISEE